MARLLRADSVGSGRDIGRRRKTPRHWLWGGTMTLSCSRGLAGLLGVLLGGLSINAARADEILVGNVTPTDTIGAYTTSGATVNASLISLPSPGSPVGIAVSGSDVFVSSQCCMNPGSISEYTTSGLR